MSNRTPHVTIDSKGNPHAYYRSANDPRTVVTHSGMHVATALTAADAEKLAAKLNHHAALVEALDGLHHWILQILQSDIADDAVALRPRGADVARAGHLLAEIDNDFVDPSEDEYHRRDVEGG